MVYRSSVANRVEIDFSTIKNQNMLTSSHICSQVFEELTKAIYANYKANKRQSPTPEVAKLRLVSIPRTHEGLATLIVIYRSNMMFNNIIFSKVITEFPWIISYNSMIFDLTYDEIFHFSAPPVVEERSGCCFT